MTPPKINTNKEDIQLSRTWITHTRAGRQLRFYKLKLHKLVKTTRLVCAGEVLVGHDLIRPWLESQALRNPMTAPAVNPEPAGNPKEAT